MVELSYESDIIIELAGPVENPQLVKFFVSPSLSLLPPLPPSPSPSFFPEPHECSPSINTSP